MRRLAGVVVALAMAPVALTGTGHAAVQAAGSDDVEYEVLSVETQDPLGIDVAPDGRVLWTEREGTLNVLKPDGSQVVAGHLPVSAGAYGGGPPGAPGPQPGGRAPAGGGAGPPPPAPGP